MILKDKIITLMINIIILKLYLTQRNTLWNRHFYSIQTLTFGPQHWEPRLKSASPYTDWQVSDKPLQLQSSFAFGLLFVCVWITTLLALRSKKLCQGPLETRKFQHQSLAEIRPSKCKLILEDNVTSGTCQWDLLCFLSKARAPTGKLAQCFV